MTNITYLSLVTFNMILFLNLRQKSALNLHCWTVWHKELVHVHCHLAAVVELTKFGSTRPTHYQLHQPNIDQTTKLVLNIITKLQQHSKWSNAANIPIFKVIKYITFAKPACQTLLKRFLCFFLWLGFSATLTWFHLVGYHCMCTPAILMLITFSLKPW